MLAPAVLAAEIAGSVASQPPANYVPRPQLVSVDPPDGNERLSYNYCSISDDGRYVVYSETLGMDLNRGIFRGYHGIGSFLVDRAEGTPRRIEPPRLYDRRPRFEYPTISGDGEWVAFVSDAGLFPDDTNDVEDVFVWHRRTGAVERVSVSSGGAQANGPSGRYDINVARAGVEGRASVRTTSGEMCQLAISADGRFIAFASAADNLVAGDDNEFADVFLRDRVAGTTTLVSMSTSGRQGDDGHSHMPTLSPDGRYVAFVSRAGELDVFPTNGSSQVFVRDLARGVTACVSLTPQGRAGTGDSEQPSFSADGRFVVFVSQAMDLVPGDRDDRIDVFIRDLRDMSLQRIESGDPENEEVRRWYWQSPSLNHDGTLLVFGSTVSHHPDDTNNHRDVYLLDRRTGEYRLLSRALRRGEPAGNGPSGRYSTCITPDGRTVAFTSVASNLVEVDERSTDVFVIDLEKREWDAATP